MAAEDKLELDDIVGIFRRRKAYLIWPFLLIMAAAAYVALTLPPVYQASAKIMVERQEIPRDIVETTVTGYVDERIEAVARRVLTDDNLWKIAKNLDLYPGERDPNNIGATAARMRADISREMESVNVSTRSGRRGSATIAFSLSFEYGDAEKARDAVNALAALFVSESQKGRLKQAQEVSRFLTQETDRLRKKITSLEDRLAEFKREHANTLPGMSASNIKLQELAQSELRDVENKIQVLEQRKARLEVELAAEDPTAGSLYGGKKGGLMSPEDRLSALRSQYISASASYAPDHPDLVRMRREIKALESQVGGSSRTSNLIDEYEANRRRLSELRQRYSDAYPDVRKLKRKVASLEKQLNRELAAGAGRSARSRRVSNPRYVTLKSQLEALEVELRNLRKRPAELRKKIEEYQRRLLDAPGVEKEYLALTRDYDAAKKKYREISEKQGEATLAQQLESSSKGERFVLAQPANTPLRPIKPNRPAILIIGLFLALGTGAGLASVAEYYDRTIHGARSVKNVTGAPPLVAIPDIDELLGHDKPKAKKIQDNSSLGKVALILLLVAVIGVVGMHYFWKPIDQLWMEATGNDLTSRWEDMLKNIDRAIGQNLGGK